jgi:hypothetical protein
MMLQRRPRWKRILRFPLVCAQHYRLLRDGPMVERIGVAVRLAWVTVVA